MRKRTVVIWLLLAAAILFIITNWSAFVTPTHLSLILTQVDAPLGLVMLGFLALFAIVFTTYWLFWQGTTLLEFRRQAKELQAQRTLADQAEASRLTEFQGIVTARFNQIETQLTALEHAVKVEIRENSNSIAASIAEFDDRSRSQHGSSDPTQ